MALSQVCCGVAICLHLMLIDLKVHDLHIWSLSESKLVASMHVLVEDNAEFTRVSSEVRRLLHRFGVHSSTIQPELLDGGKTASIAGSIIDEQEDGDCMIRCVDDSCVDSSCCPPAVLALAKK